MGELPKLPGDQLFSLLPFNEQFGQKDCFVFALHVLGGRATDCEVQLAMYILHRLGICNLHVDWRYKPCTWVTEDSEEKEEERG